MQDEELEQIASEACSEAWEIANSTDGWKVEKKNDHGDVVVCKKNKKGKYKYNFLYYTVLDVLSFNGTWLEHDEF